MSGEPGSRPQDLLARFRGTVAAAPDRPALHTEGHALSFAELDQRVGQLAAVLRDRGVIRGDLVGLHLPRCADLVAGMLATWQVGAAYLPLDPVYPPRRLQQLVAAAAPVAVLSRDPIPQWPAVPPPAPQAPVDRTADATVAPEDLAYVLYTSGSTGAPKGVQVTRGGVAALVAALEAAGYLGSEPRRVLWNASASFDASVQQWTRICRGDTVFLATDALRSDPAALARFLGEHGITDIDATPSHWRLLDAELTALGTPLRVFLGGEAVPPALWRRLAGDDSIEAINLYGPTETTVDATAVAIGGDEPNIGRPLPGIEVRIVDPELQPVVADEIGEICITGSGVARGYLNAPGATAERFVPDLDSVTGGRLYRSGDRGRWRPDGTIDYLGRTDRQRKLNGYRVDLTEIETTLSEHSAVAAAVAVVRPGPDRTDLLVYYTSPGDRLEPARLREFVVGALPEWMVPTRFIAVESMPLNASGKVDEAVLLEATEQPALAEAPAGAVEELLAKVWSEVLGRTDVSATDNFFDLGGHSLMALRVVAEVHRRLGIRIRTSLVYARPRLRDLAASVSALQCPPEPTPVVSTGNPVPAEELPGPDLPASSGQRQMWMSDRVQADRSLYHLYLVLEIDGQLDREALRRSLDDFVARHASLRTGFVTTADGPFRRVAPAVRVELPMSDFSGLPAADRDRTAHQYVEAFGRLPFDLDTAPLVRSRLVRLAPDRHVLLFSPHHTVLDASSAVVFYRELAILYGISARVGQPASLPAPTGDYDDYVAWQAALPIEEGLQHWRDRLGGYSAQAFPSIRSGSGRQETHALWCPLEEKLAARVREVAVASRVRPFRIMLAGLHLLLSGYLGVPDSVIAIPVTVSKRRELPDVIGNFINTVVHRVTVSRNQGFGALLRSVDDSLTADLTHRDVPFEAVVHACGAGVAGSGTPFTDVSFNLLEEDRRPAPTLPGLEVRRPVVEAQNRSEFPLAFNVRWFGNSSGSSRFELGFDSALLSRADVERIGRDWTTLLGACLVDLDTPVGEVLQAANIRRDPSSPPAPVPGGGSGAAAEITAPAVLQAVLELWQEVLHRTDIAEHDNFFATGGYSLSAMQVGSRLGRALDLDVPVMLLFEHPVAADYAAQVSALRTAGTSARPPVGPRQQPDATSLPASFAQRRFWFINELTEGSPQYNLVRCFDLQGDLDVDALRSAVRHLVQRHAALRTTVIDERGVPRQRFRSDLPEDVVLWENLAAGDADTAAARLAETTRAECDHVFDLAAGPLLRVRLVTVGRTTHRLMTNVHHIVSDGWSMTTLQRELAASYAAFRRGREPVPPALPIDYADYSMWQEEQAAKGHFEADLAYWTEAMRGAPAATELPFDRRRPPRPDLTGSAVRFLLADDLVVLVRAFARVHRTTLATVLLSTFQTMLFRYTRSGDLVIGTSAANRARDELEPIVGLFMNQLPIRAQLSGQMSSAECVAATGEALRGAMQHQELPFELIVEHLAPPRDLSHEPYVQAFFDYQDGPSNELTLEGLSVHIARLPVARSKFELRLEAVEWPDRVECAFGYRLDLFDSETIEQMSVVYQSLLRAVVEDPACPIDLVRLEIQAGRP